MQRSIEWGYKSRYASEFIEGALLGKGGFGSVHMATNRLVWIAGLQSCHHPIDSYKLSGRLDRVTYAVKKIHIILSRFYLSKLQEHKLDTHFAVVSCCWKYYGKPLFSQKSRTQISSLTRPPGLNLVVEGWVSLVLMIIAFSSNSHKGSSKQKCLC